MKKESGVAGVQELQEEKPRRFKCGLGRFNYRHIRRVRFSILQLLTPATPDSCNS
jgi:hypothetical protein